jgi:hypothetical protein
VSALTPKSPTVLAISPVGGPLSLRTWASDFYLEAGTRIRSPRYIDSGEIRECDEGPGTAWRINPHWTISDLGLERFLCVQMGVAACTPPKAEHA